MHITGGGLIENPSRVYDDDVSLVMDFRTKSLPPLFLGYRQLAILDI